MRRAVRFFLGLAALALGSAAPAQSGPEGLYVTDTMETASALELAPDGRFRWMLTVGALDMTAEGRWRRDGNDVLLDTEPPVEPPRFEFLGAGREQAPGLVVRVAGPRGRTPEYLDAEAEYDSGAPGYAHLDEDAYRFEPAPGRRILAIRVGSHGFRFWSERYPVPADANQMRFRFFPGDLGRANFRAERATIDGDSLTLNVLGGPVRYLRLTAEQNAELQTAIAEIAAGAAGETDADAPEQPAAPPAPAGPAPPVEVLIGEAVDSFVARAPPELRPTGEGLIPGIITPVELSYRFGERVFAFGRVGGADYLWMGIDTSWRRRQVDGLSFSYQDRLLTLAEVLERARGLESWLRAGGFEIRPDTAAEYPEPASFTAIAHARDDDGAFVDSGAVIRGADWASTAQVLGDEAVSVVTMHLFTLKTGDIHAIAYLDNLRRMVTRYGGTSDLDHADGREWRLNVRITLDPAIIQRDWSPPEE